MMSFCRTKVPLNNDIKTFCSSKDQGSYDMMKGVLKVSPSVVGLKTTAECDIPDYQDHVFFLSWVNGIIFSCEEDKNSGLYHSFILTSADVLRQHRFQGGKYTPPASVLITSTGQPNFVQKIQVQLHAIGLYTGEVVAFDLDYHIAVVKIESDVELPIASLMCIDHRISIGSHEASTSSVQPDQNPNYFKMIPGEEAVVVGRRFGTLCDLIACSGKFSVDYLCAGYDSKNLFRINCRSITNGGPVINFGGYVIGIAFGCRSCTGFLPINLFLRWWKHYRTYKEICRPSLGIRVANLFTAHITLLDHLVNLLDISDGVIVEEVESGSPPYVAGIRPMDVIFQCDGRLVRSSLEFFELIWDKKGEVMEVTGVRDCSIRSWTVKVDVVKPQIPLDGVISGSLHCGHAIPS